MNSLINLHGESDLLTPKEVDDLLLAYSDYREQLTRYQRVLTLFQAMNNLAIDNKVITIDPLIEPQDADRVNQKVPPAQH